MKKKLFIVLLVVTAMVAFTGCNKKEDKEKKAETSVVIGEKTYIEQLSKIKIEGTSDYFKITKKVKMENLQEADGDTTVSFTIGVPYVINVDGVDYEGTYVLGGYKQVSLDKNPKYTFEVTNLNENYEIEVLINKK
ncbi:MAG: hypothetical protein IKN87_02905 [Bacilli bacterium]|nr:hypothetical protein [Bacilli bacterium]